MRLKDRQYKEDKRGNEIEGGHNRRRTKEVMRLKEDRQ